MKPEIAVPEVHFLGRIRKGELEEHARDPQVKGMLDAARREMESLRGATDPEGPR